MKQLEEDGRLGDVYHDCRFRMAMAGGVEYHLADRIEASTKGKPLRLLFRPEVKIGAR